MIALFALNLPQSHLNHVAFQVYQEIIVPPIFTAALMIFSRLFAFCIMTTLAVVAGTQISQAAFTLNNSQWIFQGIDLGDVWIEPVKDELATIRFENGRVNGSTGCNSFNGRYKQSSDKITFSGFATTRMLCPDALMEQERALLDGLGSAESFEFDEQIIRFETKQHGALLFRRFF